MCQNLAIEMIRAYDGANLAPLGETRGPFERARDELVWFDEAAVPVLVELLPARDGVVPVVIADVLRRIGAPATLPVAELLDREAWRTRRVAAELLGDLPRAGEREDGLQERLARLAAGDPEWIVRAQAARSLGRRGANHTTLATAREGLLPVLADPDPAVGREAAAALALLGDPAATPALLNYLERGERAADARAQKAGLDALRAVTGAKVQGGARAWREHWVDHRGELLQTASDRPY
jgi:HEAT repeat protein